MSLMEAISPLIFIVNTALYFTSAHKDCLTRGKATTDVIHTLL